MRGRFRLSLAHLSGCLGDDQGFALVRPRLGNFESVFALFRDPFARSHPLAPSGKRLALGGGGDGLAGARPGLAALRSFVRRVFPCARDSEPAPALRRARRRAAFRCCTVSLTFQAIAFRHIPRRNFAPRSGAVSPAVLATASLAAFLFSLSSVCCSAVVSLAWFFGFRSALPLPGRLGVENVKQAATVANRGHRFSEAISLVDHGLEWAPLDWQLYFLRAVARIGARESLPPWRWTDFRRARFLEPDAYQLPFEERQGLARLAADARHHRVARSVGSAAA